MENEDMNTKTTKHPVQQDGFINSSLGIGQHPGTAGKIANVAGRVALLAAAVYGGIKLFSGDDTIMVEAGMVGAYEP